MKRKCSVHSEYFQNRKNPKARQQKLLLYPSTDLSIYYVARRFSEHSKIAAGSVVLFSTGKGKTFQYAIVEQRDSCEVTTLMRLERRSRFNTALLTLLALFLTRGSRGLRCWTSWPWRWRQLALSRPRDSQPQRTHSLTTPPLPRTTQLQRTMRTVRTVRTARGTTDSSTVGVARRQTRGWCRWLAACACGVGLREAHGSRHRPRSRTRSRTQTTGNRGSLDYLILLSFFLSSYFIKKKKACFKNKLP